MKTTLIVAAAFVVITTAANADGYRAATNLEQVKAQCELVADGMVQPDSPYYGDPRYAGFDSFGKAVGGAIRHARDYDNCMVLHGFAKAQSPNNDTELSSPEVPNERVHEPVAPSKPKAQSGLRCAIRDNKGNSLVYDFDLPKSGSAATETGFNKNGVSASTHGETWFYDADGKTLTFHEYSIWINGGSAALHHKMTTIGTGSCANA